MSTPSPDRLRGVLRGFRGWTAVGADAGTRASFCSSPIRAWRVWNGAREDRGVDGVPASVLESYPWVSSGARART
eukprot:3314485-Pyramimonas_sp.AAC.1